MKDNIVFGVGIMAIVLVAGLVETEETLLISTANLNAVLFSIYYSSYWELVH